MRYLAFLLLLAGCASSREFGAMFSLPDETHHVLVTTRGTALVLQLQRGDETLDRVEATLGRGEASCLSLARGGEHFVVFGRDDPPEHAHPVTRAWRVDLANRRLVATSDLAGLTCEIDECNDDEER